MPHSRTPIESPLGRWDLHIWRPAPGTAVADVVDAVQYFDGVSRHPRGRILPHPSIKLVLSLDEPYRVVTPGGVAPFPVAYLAGVPSGPVVIEAPTGRARTLNIRLRPTGVYRLLKRRPLAELTNVTVSLHDLFGPMAVEFVERCYEARSTDEHVRIAVDWLSRAATRSPEPDAEGMAVAWIAGQLARSGGTLAIGQLRERTGFSEKRLVSAFRAHVGITPKRYARMVRFRRAFALLDAARSPSLSGVAFDAGYYDQAHMTAEFRELGGLTPAVAVTIPRFSKDIIKADLSP